MQNFHPCQNGLKEVTVFDPKNEMLVWNYLHIMLHLDPVGGSNSAKVVFVAPVTSLKLDIFLWFLKLALVFVI